MASRYHFRIPMMIAGIAVVLIVAIAEIVMAAKWTPSYWTVGLPIFARRVERPNGLADLSLDELSCGSKTMAASAFVFRQVDPQTIAFREEGLQYVPLMRGVIRHEVGEPSVVVFGLVNWFVVALVVVLVVGLRRNVVVVLPALALGLGVLYFIQGVRFWRVASQLAAGAHDDPQRPQA
jgi:hypothetical protein